MTTPEMVFERARLDDGALVSIAVAEGRIVSIGPEPAPEGAAVVDLGGALVVPAFVEGHVHLDTSFYGDAWRPHIPCTAGFDVRERVAFQARNLAAAAPMAKRAADQIALCLAQGSTRMRSHVMVDGSVGLASVETILAVREDWRDRIDIEIVAFPQSGILASPGTAELLDAAVGLGCAVVGGLDPASFDGDVEGYLDVVFGIAEWRGVGVDIHLHDGGTLGVFTLERIAARTRALDMGGRVAVSHAYALGDVPADVLARTAGILAWAGVAIMTNAPGAHAFPPVKALVEAGVCVFGGSDNIRDSWWPYGDGDMLGRAMMIAYRSGFLTDADLRLALDVVTSGGARALGIERYGLVPGARTDFVVLPAAHVPEAVVAVPKRRDVYRAGRLVARDGKLVRTT